MSTASPIVYHLDELDGHDFEAVMVELFQRLGYEVERGPETGDEGRDLILRLDAFVAIVECKHQMGTIGRPVVQKAHSAGLTYPGAVKAIIVSTSSFSEGATEYAQRLNAQDSFKIELWDYARLVEEARAANVFLPKQKENTAYYFTVRTRAESALAQNICDAYFSRLRSSPRPTASAIVIRGLQRAVIPVIAVDYQVNKPFTTQVGTIYRATANGRMFFNRSGTPLAPAEAEYWARSSVELIDEKLSSAGAIPALFGVSPRSAVEQVRSSVAGRLSRNIRYWGRNGRAYLKWCLVAPRDVWTTSRQMILFRNCLSFRAGPKAYSLTIADDASRSPRVIATTDMHGAEAAFLQGRALICNDCGLISAIAGRGKGASCGNCGRTLCNAHHWMYPRKLPAKWQPLCSSCYHGSLHSDHYLDREPSVVRNAWLLTLLSLIPGFPFLVAERLSAGLFGTASIAAVFGTLLIRPSVGLLVAGLVMASSIAASWYWRIRIRKHQSNIARLVSYRPEWG